MLSICIPVYNNNVTELVKTLYKLCQASGISFEIICIDDSSSETFQKINATITISQEIKYSELTQNVGRAVIRNLLAEEAKYENILYLDSDVSIPNKDFIKKYVDRIRALDQVIIGGVCYDDNSFSKNTRLHFNYGRKRESKSAECRNKKPHSSFLTGNLLVKKILVQKIQFLSSLKDYGHEDTLFCIELKKHSIPVIHIENPVVHKGLETNVIFIEKQLTAVKNLATLIKQGYDMSDISLYAYYLLLKKYRVAGFFRIGFGIIKPVVKKILESGWSNWLLLFDALRLHELSIYLKKT